MFHLPGTPSPSPLRVPPPRYSESLQCDNIFFIGGFLERNKIARTILSKAVKLLGKQVGPKRPGNLVVWQGVGVGRDIVAVSIVDTRQLLFSADIHIHDVLRIIWYSTAPRELSPTLVKTSQTCSSRYDFLGTNWKTSQTCSSRCDFLGINCKNFPGILPAALRFPGSYFQTSQAFFPLRFPGNKL